MTPTLGDLFLISGKVSWLCPSVNEGAGGAQDFQLQQDFVVCLFFFLKKRFYVEMSGTMIKINIIKIPNQNTALGPVPSQSSKTTISTLWT